MKILLCHNYYQRPGGEDQVFHDERALLESRGHEVICYTRHNDEIRGQSLARVAWETIWNSRSAREVRGLIRTSRPDVMHCTNVFPLISPAIYSAAKAESVPVVQSLHNYRLFCANGYFLKGGEVCEACLHSPIALAALRHKCYRGERAATATVVAMQTVHRVLGTWQRAVDRFISCSEFARQRFIAGGLRPDRVVVKPNFVQPDTGIGPGGGRYVVFVGRLSKEKGIDTLLQAWSKFSEPWSLKIIGDGPLRASVEEASARDSRIQCLGWRDLASVLDMLGNAEMLVMPSIWYETFGRVIIEAYSKGTPVIVSRLGAMAELVDDGRTGRLFNPGEAEDLAAKMAALAGDADLRMSMRQECRVEYEAKYTADENYQQLIDIYRQVLGQPARPFESLELAQLN